MSSSLILPLIQRLRETVRWLGRQKLLRRLGIGDGRIAADRLGCFEDLGGQHGRHQNVEIGHLDVGVATQQTGDGIVFRQPHVQTTLRVATPPRAVALFRVMAPVRRHETAIVDAGRSVDVKVGAFVADVIVGATEESATLRAPRCGSGRSAGPHRHGRFHDGHGGHRL